MHQEMEEGCKIEGKEKMKEKPVRTILISFLLFLISGVVFPTIKIINFTIGIIFGLILFFGNIVIDYKKMEKFLIKIVKFLPKIRTSNDEGNSNYEE